jgi:hypothetical protein
MIFKNKLIPVALGAALLGGSVGAFVMRPKSNEAAQNAATVKGQTLVANPAPAEQQTLTANNQDNAAFREGFVEGVRAAREEGLAATSEVAANTERSERVVPVSRTRTRTVRSRSGSGRQVYYDYNQPRKRSFWQKHRDKLTVGIGAGSGAVIGGLVGGKKGALIGALAGGGGAALYTYKLRNRDRRY